MKQFPIVTVFIFLALHLFSQGREIEIVDTDNDDDAVFEIKSNDPAASNYTEMILGFNTSNQGWLRTTTNHDLSFWTNNSRRFTIKNDGRVGIGTSNPAADFEVQGNTILQSTNGTITITTSAATVEVLPNGNINILSSGNIDVDADGNLNLSADGDIDIDAGGTLNIVADQFNLTSQSSINLNANNDLFTSAQNSRFESGSNAIIATGKNLTNTVGIDYNLNVGNDMITDILNNYDLDIADDHFKTISGSYFNTISGNHQFSALNSTQSIDSNFQLFSGTVAALQSPSIGLNAGTNGARAARVGDTIAGNAIATGSLSVVIGN